MDRVVSSNWLLLWKRKMTTNLINLTNEFNVNERTAMYFILNISISALNLTEISKFSIEYKIKCVHKANGQMLQAAALNTIIRRISEIQ